MAAEANPAAAPATSMYELRSGTDEERAAVRELLPEIDNLSPLFADLALTAWVTSWRSSPYETLDDFPMGPPQPNYPLLTHVRDVTIAGIELARIARERWGREVDDEVVLALLLLHDIDKPLIYLRGAGGAIVFSDRGRALPHGVLGAMILRDLGFPDEVTSIVATHANGSPFHVVNTEAWILHYADMFAVDHGRMLTGATPMYQKKG